MARGADSVVDRCRSLVYNSVDSKVARVISALRFIVPPDGRVGSTPGSEPADAALDEEGVRARGTRRVLDPVNTRTGYARRQQVQGKEWTE